MLGVVYAYEGARRLGMYGLDRKAIVMMGFGLVVCTVWGGMHYISYYLGKQTLNSTPELSRLDSLIFLELKLTTRFNGFLAIASWFVRDRSQFAWF